MGLIIALFVSYLVGSIPTGYLLVRWVARTDVRRIGSGNVGATNVTRAAGAGAGLAVLLLDIAKGLMATCVLAPWLVSSPTTAVRLACGVAAVLGHTFPVWLRFTGGKGVATAIGTLLGAEPRLAAVSLGVWAVLFAARRIVSLASVGAAVAFPIAQMVAARPLVDVLLGAGLALLIIVRHRANLARLAHGTEPKFSGRTHGPEGACARVDETP